MKDNFERHESYGMVSVCRVSNGEPQRLFGSDVKHRNTIRLEIKQGGVNRDYNKEWYSGQEVLAEIEFSPVQFAECIANMNTSGVPCTIRYINNKHVENPPEILNKKEMFRSEFKEDLDKLYLNLQESIKTIEDSINKKKPLNKSEKDAVLNSLYKLTQDLKSNIPYMAKCFDEQMNKAITSGKSEIEAYIQNKINALGLEKLKDIKNNMIQLEE